VVVAELAAPPDAELDRVLGEDGAAELRGELAARARRWAAAAAPGKAFEASTVGAAQAAVVGHRGPVLLAAPDVPGLDQRVVDDALGDIAHGCDVVIGAAHDARPYLVALSSPREDLFELAETSFARGVLGAFAERGLVLGMLRSERRLASAADVRAMTLDPHAPAELVALLTRLGGGAGR
jgi:Uncharacterized protein conserved in bacteria (DUF2064)